MIVRRWTRRALGAACLGLAVLGAGDGAACDVCAIYTATEQREDRTGFTLGVAEQLTRFTSLNRDGTRVPNPADETETSAITQVILGYHFTPRLGLQLNLPIISRTFTRVEDGRRARGDETGVGDLTLLADVLAFHQVTEKTVLRVHLLGGLKLPSGDSRRLEEELVEPHAGHPVASGIHGHDLALGSGSVDGILGGSLFWSWRRLFLTAAGQWALRTPGHIDYQYADDLTWETGPGVFALLSHRYSLGVQAVLSGETKGKDRLGDEVEQDTGITALYLGPALSLTWGAALGATLVAEIPVRQHTTGLQAVPDFRLRGGLTWRF